MVNNDTHEWQYYKGLPPDLAPLPYYVGNIYTWVAFWNLKVIRDETVPGLSNLSGNSPAAPGGYYNQTIMWSSSWNNWDIAPVDQKNSWQMSFCPVAEWSLVCGSGPAQTVDITPRRLQNFVVKPGAYYNWENVRISDSYPLASGYVQANSSGLITVPSFLVSGSGNRLIIWPRG